MVSYVSIPVLKNDSTIDYIRFDLNNNTILMKGVDNNFHILEDLNYLMHEDEKEACECNDIMKCTSTSCNDCSQYDKKKKEVS